MKAQHAVSEMAHSLRTGEGKRVASDLRNLKRNFKVLKPALHLWATYELMLADREYEGTEGTLSEILTSPKEFELFLKVAAWFEVELTPLIADWCPLRIPQRFMSAVQRGELKINLPPNPPEMDAALRTYRNKGVNS
ncbi:hypothetical protein DYI42_03660 [Vannielia litorea]|nr:hypothetical protein [Vannielia litorea]